MGTGRCDDEGKVMDELMELMWCLDESGKRIVTDSPHKYHKPEVVVAGVNIPTELLAHICATHNEWLDNQLSAEAFRQAFEKDD